MSNEIDISTTIIENVDGSAKIIAVASSQGKVLASYTLDISISVRNKFGDELLIKDLEASLNNFLSNRLKPNFKYENPR